MIISLEAITYFLTGKQKIDSPLIMKLAKIKEIKISDSMRKNIGNLLSCRHRPSETTLKNITSLLKEIVNNKQFSDKIDNVSLLDEIDLSTPELQLKHMETGYLDFFKSANSENSFLANEVNKTFKGLYELLITLKENGTLEVEIEEIEKELSESKLLPKIDYSDSLYLKIENKVNSFSLDLLLYYFACIAVDNKEGDASLIQVMFDYLLQELTNATNRKFKSPFACYISIIKLHNKKITNEKIKEVYDIGDREFYFYKSGKRTPPPKIIALMIEQGHMLYFMTLFWTKLIVSFSVDVNARQEIMNKINLYPKLFDIAKVEFCDFERQNKKTGHD